MAGNPPQITEREPRRFAQAIQELFQGRSNAVGSVTLTAGATTTVVTAINCGRESRPFLEPTTANAATARATTYVSSVGSGTFTITHANTAQTDRTFFWVALG